MPKIKIIAAGASDAPSIPTATAFFDVMEEIEALQDQHCEALAYYECDCLSEAASIVRTLGNFLSCDDYGKFLVSELQKAERELVFYRQLVNEAS